jgi:hypothetical protein
MAFGNDAVVEFGVVFKESSCVAVEVNGAHGFEKIIYSKKVEQGDNRGDDNNEPKQ